MCACHWNPFDSYIMHLIVFLLEAYLKTSCKPACVIANCLLNGITSLWKKVNTIGFLLKMKFKNIEFFREACVYQEPR